MERPVTIQILSTIERDGEKERISQSVSGTYHADNGSHTIHYRENHPNGTTTYNQFYFDPQIARLLRSGSVQSTMEFTPGIQKTCNYTTELGTIMLKTYTKAYDSIWHSPNDIRIKITYDLFQEEILISTTTLRIRILG